MISIHRNKYSLVYGKCYEKETDHTDSHYVKMNTCKLIAIRWFGECVVGV